jgi:N-acetylmuramoyl-L-alanine amidase
MRRFARNMSVSGGPALLLAALAACGGRPPVTAAPAPEPAATRFPAMPVATGALQLRIVYPPRNATITVTGDSTFIFGSVGNGAARLTINGSAVPVLPNGSFLAFVPVPRESQRFALEAALGATTERLDHEGRVTPRPPRLSADAPLAADPQSVRPGAGGSWPAGERFSVSVRATPNASVMLMLGDGRLLPLAPAAATHGDAALFTRPVVREDLAAPARLIVTRGSDTLRLPLAAQGLLDSSGTPRVAVLRGSAALPDTDRVVIARPAPNGTYKWLLLPGTAVEVTGRQGGQVRVRLDAQQEAWIDSSAIESLGDGAVVPRRIVGNPRVNVASDGAWADVVLPMAAPAPFLVQQDERAIVLTLHGATADIDIAVLRSDTTIVRAVTWQPQASDRAEVTVHLAHAPFGYLVRWQPGAMVLRVRRPPAVTPGRPLTGLTIAVDPGHPPVGATGPTGLYEGDAVLPIAEHLRDELTRRGASVVMTRTTRDPVGLAERPVIARRANAHAFVSIHLNALPDGVNPFTAHGTGTYYFHPHSLPLARDVQRGMVRHMGLRDLGVYYDNLAVVRQTWMPSVLCEGAFLMIPEQEALLRTPEFQRAYARGVADGLEAYFRSLAASGAMP